MFVYFTFVGTVFKFTYNSSVFQNPDVFHILFLTKMTKDNVPSARPQYQALCIDYDVTEYNVSPVLFYVNNTTGTLSGTRTV